MGEAPDYREVECNGECLGRCDLHDPLDPGDRAAMETLVHASQRGIGSVTMFAKQAPQDVGPNG